MDPEHGQPASCGGLEEEMPTVETLQKEAMWLIFLFPDILSAVTLKLLGFQMSISQGIERHLRVSGMDLLGSGKKKALIQVSEIL